MFVTKYIIFITTLLPLTKCDKLAEKNVFHQNLNISFLQVYQEKPFSKEFFSSILNNVFISSVITEPCLHQYKEFIANLSTTQYSWAQEMVNSNAEIPKGLVTLEFVDFGNFDQCINTKVDVNNETISGKFCRARVFPGKNLNVRENYLISPAFWSFCVPNKCSKTDIILTSNIFINILLQTLDTKLYIKEGHCLSNEDINPKLTTAAIAAIAFLILVTVLVTLVTFYEIFTIVSTSKSHPLLIKMFSIYSNGKQIFKISKGENHMTYLDGLKVFSTLWVIIFHQYQLTLSVPATNTFYGEKWVQKFENMLVISGTLSVDTFFLIGGVLTSLNFFKSRERHDNFNLLWYYLHRYIRLTSVLAVMVLINATLIRYIGSGPIWYSIIDKQNICIKNWWTALLYIQNYANPSEICLGETWYLNVDMQLYLISPLILYAIWLYPKATIICLIGCCFACLGESLRLMHEVLLEFLSVITFEEQVDLNTKLLKEYFIKTHTRATPWIIGVILGYMIYKIKTKRITIKLNKLQIICAWIVCSTCFITCLFIGHIVITKVYGLWFRATCSVAARLLWPLVLSFIILACQLNYGGPINWFLSLDLHQICNKFCYSLYLSHLSVLTSLLYTQRVPRFIHGFTALYEFWGTLGFSLALTMWLVFFIEKPTANLEQRLLSVFKNSRKSITYTEDKKNSNNSVILRKIWTIL